MTASPGKWEKLTDLTYRAVPIGCDHLDPAVYNVEEADGGKIYFKKTTQNSDKVYDLPGLPNDFINSQISTFWAAEASYRRYNFIHKRGIILYGPPGNGKTCVISSLIKNLIADGGLVMCIEEFSLASRALRLLKQIEPKRKVMTLMEDMDTLLSGDYKSEEPFALSMLDGQAQVNGVVHVATTNYPEQLADRFIRRPGRFDLVIGIGMPVKETRRAYFQKILDDENHPDIPELVDRTEGLSLAYLREIASSYLCLGVPIEESVGRLKKNVTSPFKISDQSSLGFKIGYEENDSGNNSKKK